MYKSCAQRLIEHDTKTKVIIQWINDEEFKLTKAIQVNQTS